MARLKLPSRDDDSNGTPDGVVPNALTGWLLKIRPAGTRGLLPVDSNASRGFGRPLHKKRARRANITLARPILNCAQTMLSLRTLVRLCCVGSALGGQLHFISEEICLRSPLSLSQCGRDRPEKFRGLMPSALDVGDATGPSLFHWDFKPRCITPDEADEPFCLYSSHSFASGRGISILTTPDRIESIMQLPAFAQSNYSHGPGTPASPPFEERELPGRGRGLIANKTVFRGDRIFAYTPVLLLDDEAYEALDDDEWVKLEAAAVEQLPAASRAEFWQLFGQPTVNPVTDRINTNAFEIDTAKGTFYGVFPEIARLNHDCRPNAAYFFDEESFTHYVHATTTVAPGTELTITYIDPHMPRSQRRRRLSSSWGFQCTCSLCTAHASISQESDSRLKQITDLTERLENSHSSSSEMAKTLISLYEQERMHAAVSNAYRLAARAFCAEARRWETIAYARLATERTMLDEGFHDEEVDAMRRLADEPDRQPCWPGMAPNATVDAAWSAGAF